MIAVEKLYFFPTLRTKIAFGISFFSRIKLFSRNHSYIWKYRTNHRHLYLHWCFSQSCKVVYWIRLELKNACIFANLVLRLCRLHGLQLLKEVEIYFERVFLFSSTCGRTANSGYGMYVKQFEILRNVWRRPIMSNNCQMLIFSQKTKHVF